MAIDIKDRLGQRKGWIRDFVEQGIDFDEACAQAYINHEERTEIEKDSAFMEGIRRQMVENKIQFLKAYNEKVSKSKNPQDAFNKLRAAFPTAFDQKNQKDDLPVRPVIIAIGNGEIREVKSE